MNDEPNGFKSVVKIVNPYDISKIEWNTMSIESITKLVINLGNLIKVFFFSGKEGMEQFGSNLKILWNAGVEELSKRGIRFDGY